MSVVEETRPKTLPVLRCINCRKIPSGSPMYVCAHAHCICSVCYTSSKNICSPGSYPECSYCGALVYGDRQYYPEDLMAAASYGQINVKLSDSTLHTSNSHVLNKSYVNGPVQAQQYTQNSNNVQNNKQQYWQHQQADKQNHTNKYGALSPRNARLKVKNDPSDVKNVKPRDTRISTNSSAHEICHPYANQASCCPSGTSQNSVGNPEYSQVKTKISDVPVLGLDNGYPMSHAKSRARSTDYKNTNMYKANIEDLDRPTSRGEGGLRRSWHPTSREDFEGPFNDRDNPNDNDCIEPSDLWFHDQLGSHCISRRPITCPSSNCGRMVAVASLIAHFSCEHPRITLLPLIPDKSAPMALMVSNLHHNNSKCVALLLVEGRRRPLSSNQLPNDFLSNSPVFGKAEKYRNYLPIALMVGKVRSDKLFNDEDPLDDSESESSFDLDMELHEYRITKSRSFVSPKTNGKLLHSIDSQLQPHQTSRLQKCISALSVAHEGLKENDCIMIWVSGNDALCPLIYTVTAYDPDYSRHLSFRGPVHSLRARQDAPYVFRNSECLILHYNTAKYLCHNGKRPLELEVTIHG